MISFELLSINWILFLSYSAALGGYRKEHSFPIESLRDHEENTLLLSPSELLSYLKKEEEDTANTLTLNKWPLQAFANKPKKHDYLVRAIKRLSFKFPGHFRSQKSDHDFLVRTVRNL